MITTPRLDTVLDTNNIPYVTEKEVQSLLETEMDRFLHLMERLTPEDWEKPTACTAWNVRDILAHQAGSYAGGASMKENLHQLLGSFGTDGLPEDGINAVQLRDRAGKTPDMLIEEIRQTKKKAIENWAYGQKFLKLFSIPHPVVRSLSLRHLMWVIHSRDTWMHRLDICRATNQPFEQTEEHDGRIAALVMLDVAEVLKRKYNGPALIFELTGIGGGRWKIGSGEAAATIVMDVLDFNIFASGRSTYEHALEQAIIQPESDMAKNALKQILVVY